MNIRKKTGQILIKRPFVLNAIIEKADLSAFKSPPSHIIARNILGLGLILFSYVIGWPLIIVLGIISFTFMQPLILAIGGPVAYGISHLVFLIGMYITGKDYTIIFTKWLARIITEKLLGDDIDTEFPA